jgi:hypothetical protein
VVKRKCQIPNDKRVVDSQRIGCSGSGFLGRSGRVFGVRVSMAMGMGVIVVVYRVAMIVVVH